MNHLTEDFIEALAQKQDMAEVFLLHLETAKSMIIINVNDVMTGKL